MAYNLGVVPPDANRTNIHYKNRIYEIVHSQEKAFSCVLYRNGKALSYSPPKAYPIELFEEYFPFQECIIEEWVEGDAVNLFFDGEWDISTYDDVGGNNRIGNTKNTLRQRFFDACSVSEVNLALLNIRKCYSFVVGSKLSLVACYEITDNNVAQIAESCGEFRNTKVHRPQHFIANSYEEARERFASYSCDNSESPGIMLYHIPTNERSKIRNPLYEISKIDLKILYRFFYIRAQNKQPEYLTHFPEDTKVFHQIEEHVKRFIKQMHENYIDCYINKSKIPSNAQKGHLYYLHQQYLRGNCKRPITLKVVSAYIRQLNPVKLLYALVPSLRRKQTNAA